MQNVRHGRYTFFRSPETPGGTPTHIDSGHDFGVYQVGGFSRFTGMFATVSSLTFLWDMGVHSDQWLVTSSVVINSGSSIFDQLNFGVYARFRVGAATSQAPTFICLGEPIR